MTEDRRAEKTEDMLAYYRHRMKEAGAIPILCIGTTGVGGGVGRAIACIPEDVPPREIYLLLKQVVEMMEGKI